MPDYWFFLSYARSNAAGDPYIREFHQRLAKRVISSASLPSTSKLEEVGFLDESSIDDGQRWENALSDALNTARVMICLYSRAYFNSEPCGKEFEFFESRIRKHDSSNPPPLIIPVLWDPPEVLPNPLPGLAGKIQYRPIDLGQPHSKKGLDYIIRLNRFRDNLEELVIRLGETIVKVAKDYPIPHGQDERSYAKISNAFRDSEPSPKKEQNFTSEVTPVTGLGPKYVHFVYVAASERELIEASDSNTRRANATHYAEGGRNWHPFLDGPKSPVGWITQRVATSANLQHEVFPVSTGLIQTLERLDRTNTSVVLVIDPWTMQLSNYIDLMAQFDECGFINCGVLILWNAADKELNARDQFVRQIIHRTFSNNFVRKYVCFNPVMSADELTRDLKRVLREIRKRLEDRADYRRPQPGPFVPRPIISANVGLTG